LIAVSTTTVGNDLEARRAFGSFLQSFCAADTITATGQPEASVCGR
jgi:hypothetical protein